MAFNDGTGIGQTANPRHGSTGAHKAAGAGNFWPHRARIKAKFLNRLGRDVAQRALAGLGRIDAVVNSAGIARRAKVDETDMADYDAVMAVNVRGPWLATVAAHAHLTASTTGRVVNIASDTALWGAPRLMAYVASKGAVMAMTRSMARELGPDGITVNAIAPGLTLVEATAYIPEARHDLYLKGRALQRPQVPEDLTTALLFLLSPGSGFITGQLLPVNGGFVMN